MNWTISGMGFAKLGQGDYTRAEELFRESLSLARALDKQRVPDSLEGLAEVELARADGAEGDKAQEQESLKRAATLLGAAEAIRRTMKVKIIPVRVPVQERLVWEVRSRLGAEEYERAYKKGALMSFEGALSYR